MFTRYIRISPSSDKYVPKIQVRNLQRVDYKTLVSYNKERQLTIYTNQ